MATTMIPDSAPAGAPAPADGMRFVAIRANLMPEEVVAARRADVMRKRVLVGLAALAVVLAGAYAASWWQTSSAQDGLSAEQRRGAALQGQQRAYQPLVTAQASVTAIQAQLNRLLTGDLPWTHMLQTLRTAAPSGVELTQVDGAIVKAATPGNQAPAPDGVQVLNRTGLASAGTITITGAAPNKQSVAAYADRLAKVKGLASPYITNVTVTNRSVTFGLTVVITSDALGGRFATAQPAVPGGK